MILGFIISFTIMLLAAVLTNKGDAIRWLLLLSAIPLGMAISYFLFEHLFYGRDNPDSRLYHPISRVQADGDVFMCEIKYGYPNLEGKESYRDSKFSHWLQSKLSNDLSICNPQLVFEVTDSGCTESYRDSHDEIVSGVSWARVEISGVHLICRLDELENYVNKLNLLLAKSRKEYMTYQESENQRAKLERDSFRMVQERQRISDPVWIKKNQEEQIKQEAARKLRDINAKL